MHSRTLDLQVSIAKCAERLCGGGKLGHVKFLQSVVQVELLVLKWKNVGYNILHTIYMYTPPYF